MERDGAGGRERKGGGTIERGKESRLEGGRGGTIERGGGGGSAAQREQTVSITLSDNQVEQIVRAALGGDAMPDLASMSTGADFRGGAARKRLSERYRALQDNRRLSRSLLAGLLVLSCFCSDERDLGIKDISQRLDLNTSTVHRYVVTLVAAGLLERDPQTRRYRRLAQ